MQNSNFPSYLRLNKSVLIGTFKRLDVAKEIKRLLELGCIPNSLSTTTGRVVQKGEDYLLYATVKGKILID